MACALENDATSSQSLKWTLLKEFTNHEELEDYVKNIRFRSASYQTNHQIQCTFFTEKFEMSQQIRKCTVFKLILNDDGISQNIKCPTKYKVNSGCLK